MPYTGMTNKETMNYVMRGGRLAKPGICPEPVHKLMSSCWKTNPQYRPTFEHIRNKLRLFIQVSHYLLNCMLMLIYIVLLCNVPFITMMR